MIAGESLLLNHIQFKLDIKGQNEQQLVWRKPLRYTTPPVAVVPDSWKPTRPMFDLFEQTITVPQANYLDLWWTYLSDLESSTKTMDHANSRNKTRNSMEFIGHHIPIDLLHLRPKVDRVEHRLLAPRRYDCGWCPLPVQAGNPRWCSWVWWWPKTGSCHVGAAAVPVPFLFVDLVSSKLALSAGFAVVFICN